MITKGHFHMEKVPTICPFIIHSSPPRIYAIDIVFHGDFLLPLQLLLLFFSNDSDHIGKMAAPHVFFFFFLMVWSFAQAMIPSKYDGFLYGGESKEAAALIWGDTVMVEAFLDPMCPDSRDSWPPLKQAFRHYSPNLSLVVHLFPLPYHSNSYISCRALHIANKLNSSTTYPLLELFFKYQEKYYNAPTYNMSRSSIIEDLTELAVTAIGKKSLTAFISGFNDSQTDTAARISFKYGCSRGVFGTPFFFVNGMLLPDYGSALDFKKWRSIIDPLFGNR